MSLFGSFKFQFVRDRKELIILLYIYMTVVHGIEIDNLYIYKNDIKQALKFNTPIEDKLHVITVISNPCNYKKRYTLAKQFIKRMDQEENIVLYVVELCYGEQVFQVTHAKNPRHLQLRAEVPLWHKENLINLAVQKLFPADAKTVCWVDSDIEFDNTNWALDTLKILNGCKDVVQLFSHCVDMDKNQNALNLFQGFGFQYSHNRPYSKKSIHYWHPGFAWACTKRLYDHMNGLYSYGILGSGDHNMALSFIGNGLKSINSEVTDDYKNSILEYEKRVKGCRLGYVPGVIRHHFHGHKKNRKYSERWFILIENQYQPSVHVQFNEEGLIVPTELFPEKLKSDILNYFRERNEDD